MKKQKQTFMPIDDAKQTTEIAVKPEPSIDEIETIETIKTSKSKTKPSKGNYILIITEKPQAASKIAAALSGGKDKKLVQQGVSYYELSRDKKQIIVACAVGHLFNLKQKPGQIGYPVFEIEWTPNWQIKKRGDWSKKYYSLLTQLCKNAKSFIIATDYDIEGEVIGWNIIRFLAKQKDAKRMKFSSLTKEEIEKAYKNAEKTIDWGQAIAGETRHYLDWFYGINLSRALMSAIKSAGSFRIMSAGRVQGPALHLIVERERKIQVFKPSQYWQVFITINGTELKYIKDITKKSELEKFKKLKGKQGSATTTKKQESIPPPAPFDLTTLQVEAYKFYKVTPAQTLQIAQQLYLSGLISYPRTSSQKIPETINYKKILKKLDSSLTKHITRSKPIEGKKSDPAHPSIYPTGETESLSAERKKIYELIVKRFIACFCDNTKIESKKIEFITEKDRLKFQTKGMEIKQKAWLNVYPAKLAEKQLKDLNGEYKIKKTNIEEKQTQPPKRYSPASLISELAKKNLGTKATRAAIIETLYNRNYIKEKAIQATPLGISLIETLEKYSPIIIDENLTRDFEKQMQTIQTAKKELPNKEQKILEKAKKTISDISKDFKKHENKIGKELIKGTDNLREQEREEAKLILCPECKKGMLMIKYSPKFRKSFIACSAYPNCRKTFSLPQGLIKKTDKTCKECSFPMLLRIMKGKRPWLFCFNPECKTNREWRKNSKNKNNKKKDDSE